MDTLLQKLKIPHEDGDVPNRWTSHDIKPIEAKRRTWGFWSFNNFWVLVNSCIATYMTGSSLIGLGLSWWEALVATIAGQLLATVFVVMNSLPGSEYHLGFPVANRYVWGMWGSYFVVLNRILLSVVWYGYQSWVGGECIFVCLKAIWPDLNSRISNHMPASTGMTTAQFLGYILFMLLQLPFIAIRPHRLNTFMYLSAAIILIFEIALIIWALATMGPSGFGSTITSSTTTPQTDAKGWLILYALTSTIGSISAGILNQTDYARFASHRRAALWGQAISFPLYAIFSATVGILVTAATQPRYGAALWDPTDLLAAVIDGGGTRSRAAAFFAAAALVVSQVGVNVPGNALAGGFDLAATLPSYLNIRRGAYLTALLSIASNPWRLVNTATTFLAVLSAYAVFLAPMTGCMVAAYVVVHRRKIKVEDLYRGERGSVYWYAGGVDWRACVAWTVATAPHIPGLVASVNTSVRTPRSLTRLYDLCYLTGFAIAFALYAGLHALFPDPRVQAFVKGGEESAEELMRRYREEGDKAAAAAGSSEGVLAVVVLDGLEREEGGMGEGEVVDVEKWGKK